MCFASQTPGLCSALISLRLPYPVCTRFICHVLCALPHKRRVCVVLFYFPSAPLPRLLTFCLSCFVCFASQTPGLCSALISLRLPYPVCTRFICHVFVCFASQTPGLCSAFLFPFGSLTQFARVLFIMFLCASPHRHQVSVVL